MESVGRNIRKHRKAQHLTIDKLAEMAELSSNYVAMIERAEKNPSLTTFVRIINALNVSADEILCDVTNTGYKVHATELADRLAKVPPQRRETVYTLLDTLLKEE